VTRNSLIGSGPAFCLVFLARLAYGLESRLQLPFKIGDVYLVVLLLVSFLGFTKHGRKICMQLLNVIFSNRRVSIDSILQPPCPLTILVVVDWVEGLVALGICQIESPATDKAFQSLMEQNDTALMTASIISNLLGIEGLHCWQLNIRLRGFDRSGIGLRDVCISTTDSAHDSFNHK
jgi:hypothetical protein